MTQPFPKSRVLPGMSDLEELYLLVDWYIAEQEAIADPASPEELEIAWERFNNKYLSRGGPSAPTFYRLHASRHDAASLPHG